MAQAGLSQADVATALGVSTRTIVNWVSKSNPTAPSDKQQERLRRLLPGYIDGGDPVEVAIRHAELATFRQSELIAMYQRLLHDEALEDQRRAQ